MKYKLILKEKLQDNYSSEISIEEELDNLYKESNCKDIKSQLEISFNNKNIIFNTKCNTNLTMYNFNETFNIIKSLSDNGIPPIGIALDYNKIILNIDLGNLNLNIVRNKNEVEMQIKSEYSSFNSNFDIFLLEIFYGIILEYIFQLIIIKGDKPNDYIIDKRNKHLCKMILFDDSNDVSNDNQNFDISSYYNSNIIFGISSISNISSNIKVETIDVESIIDTESIDVESIDVESIIENKKNDDDSFFLGISSDDDSDDELPEPSEIFIDLMNKIKYLKSSMKSANVKYLKTKRIESEIYKLKNELKIANIIIENFKNKK
jgi:hypothetical protein